MRIIATRDDVHPADSPATLRFDMPDATAPEAILRRAADRDWLPSFADDRATWSIVSNDILAVVAYEWPDLRFMPSLDRRMRGADRRGDALRLHFNFHAEIGAEALYRLFWAMRLRSPDPG